MYLKVLEEKKLYDVIRIEEEDGRIISVTIKDKKNYTALLSVIESCEDKITRINDT
jgi:hypothetical protein